MAEINDADLDDKYWATTAQVRDRFKLEIGNENPDHEQRIIEATDAVQAMWAEATGDAVPDDLPATPPELLQYATAYLAASQAHLHFSQNISGDNEGDQRHVFLEEMSQKQFDLWKGQADLETGSETAGEEDVAGKTGVIGGSSNSPVVR